MELRRSRRSAHPTRHLKRGALLALAIPWLWACGDDAGPVDGGGDTAPDGAVDGGVMVAEAMLPPAFACPTGWTERTGDEGVTTCEPFPAGAPDDCAPHEAHLPGEAGCGPLDGTCPSGEFADDLPGSATILYVRAGATGGDGTMSAPFGTIAAALALANPGDVIALAKGRFDELVRPPRGVTLHGACTSETLLTSSAADGPGGTGVVEVREADVVLRRLGIVDSPRIGVSITRTGTVTLDRVMVADVASYGFRISGGGLTGQRVAVHRVAAASDGSVGRAFEVSGGSVVSVSQVSTLAVRDVAVSVANPGTTVTLEGFALHGTLSEDRSRSFGNGIQVVDGGSAALRDGVMSNNRELGALVLAESTLDLAGVVIRENLGREIDGAFGCGAAVQDGGTLRITGSVIERVPDIGAFASTGGVLTITDSVIRDVEVPAGGGHGRGVNVQSGSSATLERVVIARAHAIGASAFDSGTSLSLTDVRVLDTQPDAMGDRGWALFAADGAEIVGARAHLEGAYDVGLLAYFPSTRIELVDVAILDVDSRVFDGRYGRGVDVESGAALSLERAVIRGVRNVGVFAGDADASVVLTDVDVSDVATERCADTDSCPSTSVAIGFGSYARAALTASRFRVSRAELCGVQVGPFGEMDLERGVVSGCGIGACVIDEGFDVMRLTGGVEYRDNGTNLDVNGLLPVPNPVPLPMD